MLECYNKYEVISVDVKNAIDMMRTRRKLTQAQLGELLGFTPANTSRYLNKEYPRIIDLVKIADVLNYDVEIRLVDRKKEQDIIV